MRHSKFSTRRTSSIHRSIHRSVGLLYRMLCSLVNNYCYASKSYKKIRSATFTCERSLLRVDGRECNAAFIKATSYQRTYLINSGEFSLYSDLYSSRTSRSFLRSCDEYTRRVVAWNIRFVRNSIAGRCRGSSYFQVLHRFEARRGQHSI